jgi:thiamine-phosphate pyrophosphorylase
MDGDAVTGTLAEAARPLKPRALPLLILMTDAVRLPKPEALFDRLPAGAAVLLRDYDAPDRAARADALRAATRRNGLLLLIGGDWRLAAQVDADGLHLPEWLARTGRRFDRARPDWLITAAAHSRAALVTAAQVGASAALLSPVFPTRSHPGARPLGPVRFAALTHGAPLPVYALGGIDGQARRRLRGCGMAGFAGISGLIARAAD